jgi:23S rRNA (adenine-N6)-dimethyltransferase
VPASRRTPRDERRRRLGQNFLRPDAADRLVREADVRAGELVVDPGAGAGALTMAMASRGAEVVAIELDAHWSEQLAERASVLSVGRVRVVRGDFLSVRLPSQHFRVLGCPPFAQTTALLRHLLDDPRTNLYRVDLVIQWEVATKRASSPPTTLLSTQWAPWWDFRLGPRVPASQFRPVPRVDAGLLTVMRREPPLLPVAMARPYADFVKSHWPFGATSGR